MYNISDVHVKAMRKIPFTVQCVVCTRRVYNRRTYAQSRLGRNSAVRPVDLWVFKFVFTRSASLIRSVRLYPLVSALNTTHNV